MLTIRAGSLPGLGAGDPVAGAHQDEANLSGRSYPNPLEYCFNVHRPRLAGRRTRVILRLRLGRTNHAGSSDVSLGGPVWEL